MSGIHERAMTATATLSCDKRSCAQAWTSGLYEPTHWHSSVEACHPAFEAGWRVYVGKRTQHSYCPAHAPAVDMRQVYPKAVTS
jgi:hypothetical protein